MGALQQGRRHEMPPLQRRENGRRLSFLLESWESSKSFSLTFLICHPVYPDRGSSVVLFAFVCHPRP